MFNKKAIILFITMILTALAVFAEGKIEKSLIFTKTAPFIAVKSYELVIEIVSLPFSTDETEDGDMAEGKTRLLSDGAAGKKQIEYRITKINGNQIRKDAVREIILSEPINEVRSVGTKAGATGVYRRPYFGAVSSRFGARWGKQHTGIDYSGNIGDPVLAADGGTVIFAGWSGGYGNIVKISHEDGYETWYAHMSEIIAKENQLVSGGELIGKIGNTGNSTGPHLHFEVRKDGIPQNPETYVK